VSCENRWANAVLDNVYHSADFVTIRCEIRDNWDSWPVFTDVAILSDAHRTNYYHFSLEMLPRLRFLGARYDRVIVPAFYLLKPFVADLLGRTTGDRTLIPQTGVIRVIDPFLAYDTMSDDSIYWLRKACNLRGGRGHRRVYIRRSSRRARTAKGGGVCEDAPFRRFLQEYGFEVLDFGDGEQTVQEQVMKLNGCSVVVAAHGAGLTNLVYLDPPLTVIEIFGRYTIRSMYVHICATLGFSYYGIGSVDYDEANDIIVNCDEIRDVMTQIG
jgi:capsular polysaccharide biosynthesis protein